MIQFGDKLDSEKILQLGATSLSYYMESWNAQADGRGLFGSTDPESFNMRKVGSSSPVIEYVIRPHVQILCILAVHIHRDYFPGSAGISKKMAVEKFLSGFRWACDTHLSGSYDVESFLERKRWGQNWRSSLWATFLAISAFFAKSVLDRDSMEKMQRVLSFEADRFIDVMPPSGGKIDTKLEENAQDSMLMAWAINMIPEHEHVQQWKDSLFRWALNIATSMHDTADHGEYFGQSVAKRVTTQTLYPDMTAENHGFFYPQILTYSQWVVLAMSAYRFHGREEPLYLKRQNHQNTFDVLLRFFLPTGMIYEPGANDFPVFIPRPLSMAWGLWNNDPRARIMTIRILSWMDAMLVKDQNSSVRWVKGFRAFGEGWELMFQSQVGFELVMLAVLPFPQKSFFYSSGQIENAVDTRKIYPYIEICYRRNRRTTRSIAWKAIAKHPSVGLAVHPYPELILANRASLLGIPSVQNSITHWDVLFHNDRFMRDGFDTYGRIVYYGLSKKEILVRDIRVLTWSEEGMVIFDMIRALTDLECDEQYLSPIYLVNDIWTGNKLNLTSGSLHETIYANNRTHKMLNCPAFWASVEANLLFQFVWGRSKGLYFVPANGRNAPRYWKNCRLDMLAVHLEKKKCIKGNIMYNVGFYVGAGKGPRPFKCSGTPSEFFKGLVIMDGKNTIGLN